MNSFRKTKIVCTLGPATDRDGVLRSLIEKGMNVARLNFSHGTHEEHLKRIREVRAIAYELGAPVAAMLDTRGPDVRVRTFRDGSASLEQGQDFILYPDDVPGDEKGVSITYPDLAQDVRPGDAVLVDDGLMEMRVESVDGRNVRCTVLNSGTISNNKSLNFPGVVITLPFVSEQDRRDILFAIEHDLDFIAASFVRNAGDVRKLTDVLEGNNCRDIRIISKIENREGVENIDEVIRVSHGIMVARGDMGVEIPFEELPSIQKEIIRKCNRAGKPVITATQMLDSMIRNPRPTRAEITDVANAIYDGTSAIMLSGETSIGRDPVNAFATMAKIALKTERDIDYIKRFEETHIAASRNVTGAIGYATCSSAHTLGASAIISVTSSGHTARAVSRYRPACPIIATTVSEKVCRQLALTWGVVPLVSEVQGSMEELFDRAVENASGTGIVQSGDLVVITGGMPLGVSGTTNILKIHIVGDVLVEGRGITRAVASGNTCVISDDPGSIRDFNAGDIIVIHRTTDEILPVLKNASAIITEEDNPDSKAAVVGRALEIPVIIGAENATGILKSGIVITVDAAKGLVYSGVKL